MCPVVLGDSVGELAQYAELFVENDINGKRFVCVCVCMFGQWHNNIIVL